MAERRAIVIIGAGRSGTSLLCQILEKMGVPFGEPLLEADKHNTHGYYERIDIKDLRRKWFKPGVSELAHWQGYVKDSLKAIIEHQFENSSLWCLKDAGEQCFVHVLKDVFESLDVDVRYLLAVRDPAAMYESVKAMGTENDWTPSQVVNAWDAYYLELLSHVQALPVSFEDWFDPEGQMAQLKHVSNHCGLVGFADFTKLLDNKSVHQHQMSSPAPAFYEDLRGAALRGELVSRLPREPIIKSSGRWRTPMLVGTATLGQVRIEWANAWHYMILPVNLSHTAMIQPYSYMSPLRYHVAEAQNLIVQRALAAESEFEWVFFLEDDVVVPPNVMLQFAKWMHDGRFPIVSGWYNVKCNPPEPMFFRGRGNGPVCYTVNEVAAKTETINEELGLRGVMCDGVPTGCVLISTKLLRVVAENSPVISLHKQAHADGSRHEVKMREVFRTERDAGFDPETDGYWKKLATSDLEFCDRVIDEGFLKMAGFEYAAGLEWPFPVDTDIRCGHIELSSGTQF